MYRKVHVETPRGTVTYSFTNNAAAFEFYLTADSTKDCKATIETHGYKTYSNEQAAAKDLAIWLS